MITKPFWFTRSAPAAVLAAVLATVGTSVQAQTPGPAPAGASDAGVHTLAYYQRAARARARRVAVSRAELEAAEATVLKARSALLPNANAMAAYLRNQYAAIIPPGELPGAPPDVPVVIIPNNQYDVQVNVNVPIFDGTAWARARAAKLQAQASRSNLQVTEDEVVLMATRLYLQAFAAQERLRSALRSEAAARDDLRYNEARRSAGAATELTVDRSRLEVAQAQQGAIDARRVLAQVLRQLSTLTRTPVPTQVAPVEVSLEVPTEEEARVRNALRYRPESLLAWTNLELARNTVSEARWALLPSILFNFNERITNATGFVARNSVYTLTLSLRWNLDLGRFSDLSIAAANERAADQRLRQTLDDLRDAVYNARLDVVAGIATVKAAREAERVAAKAAEVARAQFRLGAATQRDVIEGERDRVRAEAQRAQAEADLVYARVALERASGNRLLRAQR